MHKIDNITKETWVLCHNEVNVFHIAKMGIGNKLESGQPFCEQFDTEAELEARVNELNSEWLIDYKKKKEEIKKKINSNV